QAGGSELCGQRLDGRPELVDGLEQVRLDRCDYDASLARLDDEALRAQDHQGMGHRLTRDLEPRGDVLLGQPLARLQGAVADGIENDLVGLLDEPLGRGQRAHRLGRARISGVFHLDSASGIALNTEFRVRNSMIVQGRQWLKRSGCSWQRSGSMAMTGA